jgi:chromosome segregation protein
LHFQRLRLSGFKSFVEATEFSIEPGLTGVVGPNGCGKSNLLEALRWVMGATSAKAMRGEGMDDVIFGGAANRPSRNHAEVLLQIDNTDRTAPAQFNDHPVLEVTRRIDRGQGSTYRVNGVETRARDVQLLFADASTGANSPSLVRQGQISELIAAKPSNRRRILEEAAGVSGLHSRRHEADLRLKAADANLARLDDVMGELESSLGRLKREARQAEKYKRLAAEIRALQGAVLYARWREADEALKAAKDAGRTAETAVAEATREAANATTQAAHAAEGLKPLREEEAVAAAVLQRLMIERDRIEREAAQAEAEVARLKADRTRIAADRARERQVSEDASATLARLTRDLKDLDAAIAAAPERVPELEAAARAAEADRAKADGEVERLAAEAAADAARRQSAAQALEQAQARQRAALARVEEHQNRLNRTRQAIERAEADRAAIDAASPDHTAAEQALTTAETALAEARAAVDTTEAKRTQALAAESEARDAARKAEDALRQLRTEAEGLKRLLQTGRKADYPPALDHVNPERGYEAALAAALGEDLDAALDARAPAYWAGASAEPPKWPKGATPLTDLVEAPPALAARLALTALVDAADGDRLQKVAPIGARLVSKEGDLWRWDGFTVRAEAPKPAALRLAQRGRLTELDAEIVKAEPGAAAASAAHRTAQAAVGAAEDALKIARVAPPLAERALAQAREVVEKLAREDARRDAQRQALGDTIARFQAELIEAEAALAASRPEAEAAEALLTALRAAPPMEAGQQAAALAAARTAAAAAREGESRARGALDQEQRAKDGRLRRREGLARDQADWSKRAEAAAKRIMALDGDAARAERALLAAQDAPSSVKQRLEKLLTEFSAAEVRRTKAADALVSAESASQTAERALRAAEQAASTAREARAAAEARLAGALERSEAAAEQVRQSARLEPDALGEKLRAEAVAIPADAQGVESHIAHLERERDALGAVNLRAEEEAGEVGERLQSMGAERADLTGAIARLRAGINELNEEGRERLQAAFGLINESFKALFETLFEGGQAELRLVESDDPLEAGLEIFACPPGKRMAVMSLMSGGEQALTATALIFAVFLANPSPICVLDEVDAPLDDANVDRFCKLLDEMRRRTQTRFIAITHNPVTMSRVDRLYGVTMPERGVSQLVSVDLRQAEALAAE